MIFLLRFFLLIMLFVSFLCGNFLQIRSKKKIYFFRTCAKRRCMVKLKQRRTRSIRAKKSDKHYLYNQRGLIYADMSAKSPFLYAFSNYICIPVNSGATRASSGQQTLGIPESLSRPHRYTSTKIL